MNDLLLLWFIIFYIFFSGVILFGLSWKVSWSGELKLFWIKFLLLSSIDNFAPIYLVESLSSSYWENSKSSSKSATGFSDGVFWARFYISNFFSSSFNRFEDSLSLTLGANLRSMFVIALLWDLYVKAPLAPPSLLAISVFIKDGSLSLFTLSDPNGFGLCWSYSDVIFPFTLVYTFLNFSSLRYYRFNF